MDTKKVLLDKHALYLAAVQDPLADVERLSTIYKEINNKVAKSFREDFAGTAALSCCWVQSQKDRTAVALELESKVVEYGLANYVSHLSVDEQKRLNLLCKNSINPSSLVDVACAFNFSYCLLHSRSTLVKYLSHVYNSLNTDGLLFLDIFGGSDSEILEVQEREIDSSDYLAPFCFEFVRESFNPVNRMSNYHINFKYNLGPKLLRAFEYKFRMWTITELRDCLAEVGFKQSFVYWEECDEEGWGNGKFYPTENEENTINWNAYVIGQR